jgi:CheY-like chemotaxis protein
MNRFLVISHSSSIRRFYTVQLEILGNEVFACSAFDEALALLCYDLPVDGVFVHLPFPARRGIAFIRHIHRRRPDLAIFASTYEPINPRLMRKLERDGPMFWLLNPMLRSDFQLALLSFRLMLDARAQREVQ